VEGIGKAYVRDHELQKFFYADVDRW